MYFGLSEDQMFFQDSIKKYLEEQASIEIVKKISQGDNNLQQEIHNGLVNLGISGILIPETVSYTHLTLPTINWV